MIALGIERQGQRRVVAITLGQCNLPLGQSGYNDISSGMCGLPPSDQHVGPDARGRASWAADSAGIAAGSTLTAVSVPMHTTADVQAALTGANPSDTASATYVTPNGTRATMRVNLGAESTMTSPGLFTM
jgi:S1-C subfamily serine protease